MIVAILQRLCDAPKFAPVCCTPCASDSFWFLEIANILQCADFLLQRAVNITAQFADMIPYLATTMQLADVSFALLQILPDGKAPCSELVLHHAMQCTGASCRTLQIPSNFAADSTQLRGSCFYPGMVLHANTFMRRCFCTGMLLYKQLLHTDAWVLVHTDTFTQRCFYGGVLLHARAFTQGFF